MIKIVILLGLITMGCQTIGIQSAIREGEGVCDNDLGLYKLVIRDDFYHNYKYYVIYECTNGKIFRKGVR